MTLRLYLPIRPEPQARPRANFKTKHAYSTHPDFYYICMLEATKKAPPRPLTGALRLCVRFMYKRPSAHNFEIYKTSRADLDNLEKAVMDALTSAKWWVDDALVASKFSTKVWGDRDCCEIQVDTLKNVVSCGEGWR